MIAKFYAECTGTSGVSSSTDPIKYFVFFPFLAGKDEDVLVILLLL